MWWLPVSLLFLLIILKTRNSNDAKRKRPWARVIQVDKTKVQAHRLSPLGLHLFIPVTSNALKPFNWSISETPVQSELSVYESQLKELGVSQVESGVNADWFSCFLPGVGIPEDKMNKAAKLLLQIYEKCIEISKSKDKN